MKDDIDYTEKIATFNLLVGNTNEEIAYNYLSMANWDETQAAILYNQENKGADAKLINTNNNFSNYNNLNNYNYINTNIIPNINQNNIPNLIPKNDDIIIPSPQTHINPININNNIKKNNSSKLEKYPECKIFEKGPLDGLKIWKVDNRGYTQYFTHFKNCMRLYENFITNLTTNIGIIYIYDKWTLNDIITIIRNLNDNEQTKDLINQRCVFHPMINSCLEAGPIIKSFKIKSYPTMLICFHKNHVAFSVIRVINNINNNIPLVTKALIEAHELFNKNKKINIYHNNNVNNNLINPIPQSNNNQINNINNANNTNNIINNININNNIINNNNNINNNIPNTSKNLLDDPRNYMMDDDIIKNEEYPFMSDGDILKKQEEEMKSLERKEEEKVRKKKEEEERKKKEEIEEKNKIESIIKQLPDEPSDDDPNKCIIMFRFPDGEKTVQRKFLKTDKISLLYIYVKSLGREIYSEKNENNFSLVQPFPFKNYNELQDNTLEQEGMFPNSVLQIRTG